MAGGKQSPRQRMINLMYLVFIAMLALNMSKEVLNAFGLMNQKLETSNSKAEATNNAAMAGLQQKAQEQSEKYAEVYQNAQTIKKESDDFYNYIENLKKEMLASVKDPKDYAAMDKADFLDQKFFSGEGYSKDGQEFVDKIHNYRDQVIAALGEKGNAQLKSDIKDRFQTGDENGEVRRSRDNVKVTWLDYNYKGFPLIASLTQLTQLQADIRTTEQDVLSTMLQGQLKAEVSMNNYGTLLQAPKTAYYQGEQFDGAIVLGRTDATTVPNEVNLTLDGRKLVEGKDYTIDGGQVKLKVASGNVGTHQIKGALVFNQEGTPVPVPVDQSYSTISKPNSAVISADKMNVVYRGVENPMTVSVPGVADNNVNANASGLSHVSGSKYVMRPGAGRTVKINVSAKIDDQTISSSQEFRIKDIPRPTGTVRGESGDIKMPRNNLEISTISAELEDFDFELNLAVSGFKFKVPGQPTVVVNGNKLNAAAKSALRRASRGDAVQIFDIEAKIAGNSSYKLKKVSPVVVELTN
ncbi:gliding motility protein GldM [Zhouia sp. PK063]|uniref:type IX secretion system motor protein PorM/GldM n=1 Tax=Zhouia sp. PK063 TaxID=3373602 RepID=UPI0037B08359